MVIAVKPVSPFFSAGLRDSGTKTTRRRVMELNSEKLPQNCTQTQ